MGILNDFLNVEEDLGPKCLRTTALKKKIVTFKLIIVHLYKKTVWKEVGLWIKVKLDFLLHCIEFFLGVIDLVLALPLIIYYQLL